MQQRLYFELDQIEEAIRDYKTAVKLKNCDFFPCSSLSNNSIFNSDYHPYKAIDFIFDYERGLILGITEGATESAIDFIPSTLSTIRGIGNGIWVFAKDPHFVTREFLESCHRLIEFIRENATPEVLATAIPELKLLLNHWSELSDYDRGYKIGYILGKYGVDILIPGTTLQAVKRFRDFRRANAFITLEKCAVSLDSRKRIMAQSLKRYNVRKSISKSGMIKINWAKQNKHIPGTNNFIPNRSEVTISIERLEKLVLDKAGTGNKVRGDVPFAPGYKERVDFGEKIGYYVYKDQNKIVKLETNKGIIHYAKDDVHVVPCAP